MAAINATLPQPVLDAMNPANERTRSTAKDAQDRFLKLLVTQMQNQDPLNPLDNAQVTSQLAQLSTVTGIDKVNSTLESLIGNYQAAHALQAANLIEHGILTDGNTVALAEGKGIMGVEFAADVDAATLQIKDTSGKVIHTVELGAQKAGSMPLLWDGTTLDGGKAASGNYTFEIKASVAGSAVEATPLQFGIVTSVTTDSAGTLVNVPGLGAVKVSDIRQIL